jgi:hypothetical protein
MGVSLFEVDRGSSQLRITPGNTTPSDGDYVMCLGSDLELPPADEHRIGDILTIDGTVDLTTPADFMLLQARFRQPADMPAPVGLAGPVYVERAARGLAPDLSTITIGAAFFDQGNEDGDIRLAGTGIIAGLYRVAYIISPTEAALATHPLAAVGGPTLVDTTATLVGSRWLARVKFDGNTVLEYDVGRDGAQQRDILMPDLTINISRFSGTKTLAFEFELVETS